MSKRARKADAAVGPASKRNESAQIVKLNVGGTKFTTLLSTLRSAPGSVWRCCSARGYDLRVVSTEDAWRTQQKRRMIELLRRSSQHMALHVLRGAQF